jgi:neutral ceramidase
VLTAGAARTNIDPPLPNDPQGFVRRDRPVVTHGDPLQITALVLENDGTVAVVLAADLAGIDVECAALIRSEVARALGCDTGAVLLNSSHSHAAPWAKLSGPKLGGAYDEITPAERAYVERLPFDFASAALMAWNSRRPARTSGATGTSSNLAVNRRERTSDGRTILGWNPDLAIDDAVPTLRVDDLEGHPIATVTAFGCHPVVVGPDVAATGTDFVGPLRRRVEDIRRGGVCVFLQGAAGNVLPLQGFFDHTGPEIQMGERLGLESAYAVVDVDPLVWTTQKVDFGSVTPISLYRREPALEQPDQSLAVGLRLVDLPMLPPPTVEELTDELSHRQREFDDATASGAQRAATNPMRYHIEWIRSMLARGDELSNWTSSRGEVWGMRVGDTAIIATPGEVFSEIGLEVRQRSPFGTTLFAGYSQGILGYVATPEEYPYGGYEPAVAQRGYQHPAPFAPEAAGILVEACLSILDELAD